MRVGFLLCAAVWLSGCSGGSDGSEGSVGDPAPFGVDGPFNDPTTVVGGSSKTCVGSECQCDVFEIVNAERADAGLPTYDYNPHLGTAAQAHAEDMAAQDYFSHTSLDGRSFSDRVRETPYEGSPRGENIALGQRNAADAMESWMNSEGHRANILSDGSTEIGVGCIDNHWVQVFGKADDD